MKNILIWGAVVAVLLGGSILWSKSKSSQTKDSDIVATKGIHWHPELTIIVNGEKQTIPANIGIGPQYSSNTTFDKQMGMTAVHTHDDASQGIIHFEFGGIVRKNDLKLGRFLEIWGKDIKSFGSNPKMTVNGIENTELANYVMKDGDKIELIY